jgi:DUF971 family protein
MLGDYVRFRAARIPLLRPLRFTWSDGHQTGIYTFPLLRNLCECDTCARARAAQAPEEGGAATRA